MTKENMPVANVSGRITRARAAILNASENRLPLRETKQQGPKRILQKSSKRAAPDENSASTSDVTCIHPKKRAVLRDVTNVCCENSYRSCFNASKVQAKNGSRAKKARVSVSKVTPALSVELPHVQAKSKIKTDQTTVKEPIKEVKTSTTLGKFVPSCFREHGLGDKVLKPCSRVPSKPLSSPKKAKSRAKIVQTTVKEEPNKQVRTSTTLGKVVPSRFREDGASDKVLKPCSRVPSKLLSPPKKVEQQSLHVIEVKSSDPDFIDIDCEEDPQLCCLYAADIYSNLCVAELDRRPDNAYMEKTQQDITQVMRGILIDWLVEVCEEYKLEADTLYLTVNLIDCFLSRNYIERQRLQLLGITCMLIASKYEEICAPRVEEFCFITDNTYSRDEVLKMETTVLKHFGFQIHAPTAKFFLRRFLRAAQVKGSPSYELEYLADYLAELTLTEYDFLKILPSVIAASAVFLARWTMDQKTPPWNTTLEHYTSYKASDIQDTVMALQALQLNTSGCQLNAVRMKYRQEKFKCVASLSSPKLQETLF